MADYELAQLNIARLQAPIDSPALSHFVANLDRINALAERSPGYVWRLQTGDGDATAIRPFGSEYIVNLSVWTDIESLHNYVYQSAHIEIMRRRKEWFEKMREAYSVLWWISKGSEPSVDEAKVKLETLQAEGPTDKAFTFKKPYPKPGEERHRILGNFNDICPA